MDSWLHGAEWLVLRRMARCESAILPLWDLPGLPQRTGNPEIPATRMESMAGAFLFGSRRHDEGASIQNFDGPRALGDEGALCCSACEPVDPFCYSVRDTRCHARGRGVQGHEEDAFLGWIASSVIKYIRDVNDGFDA